MSSSVKTANATFPSKINKRLSRVDYLELMGDLPPMTKSEKLMIAEKLEQQESIIKHNTHYRESALSGATMGFIGLGVAGLALAPFTGGASLFLPLIGIAVGAAIGVIKHHKKVSNEIKYQQNQVLSDARMEFLKEEVKKEKSKPTPEVIEAAKKEGKKIEAVNQMTIKNEEEPLVNNKKEKSHYQSIESVMNEMKKARTGSPYGKIPSVNKPAVNMMSL
jgi:hypothetical protein